MTGPAFPRTRKYKHDGQGGFAPNSGRIPIVEAALYITIGAAFFGIVLALGGLFY